MRKCLNCNEVLANKINLCEKCLSNLNEIRNSIDLPRWAYRKSLISSRYVLLCAGILILVLFLQALVIPAKYPVLSIRSYFIIFTSSSLCFLLNFSVAKMFIKRGIKNLLRNLSNKEYYKMKSNKRLIYTFGFHAGRGKDYCLLILWFLVIIAAIGGLLAISLNYYLFILLMLSASIYVSAVFGLSSGIFLFYWYFTDWENCLSR